MDECSVLVRARPLRLRLTDQAFTKLADIAVREDRPIERQAERLLRQAIESDRLTASVEPGR
jgi:hypothetical protein